MIPLRVHRHWLVLLVTACGHDARNVDAGSNDDAIGECVPGVTRCEGRTRLECGPAGTYVVAEECPDVCEAGLGCVVCKPGSGVCDRTGALVCQPDGSGYVVSDCDPLQGLSCDVNTGLCAGECSAANLGRSYIGCEYYPTVTASAVDNAFNYAIAVSNTSAFPTNVHVEGGALTTPIIFVVAPNAVRVQVLPWVPKLKACTNAGGDVGCNPIMESSALVASGAYHLRSDRPVTVYQFNPLEYTLDAACTLDALPMSPECSYTNDASLLLPVNAWTHRYIGAAYPPQLSGSGGDFPGFLTITASRDNTEVTLVPRAAVDTGAGVVAMPAFIPSTITLNAGDAVQLFSTSGDLTGSTINSTAAVQVIGGHYCTTIPDGILSCDHLEESILPLETLGAEYAVTAPATPDLPAGRIRVVRIVATEPLTTLTYDPPQPDAPSMLVEVGAKAEIVGTRADFKITANRKVLVAQFMEGRLAEGDPETGDPSMTLAIPIEQYRSDYQFHAPQNYQTLYVNVVAPMSATVALDGVTLTGFTPIGSSGLGILRHELAKNGTGNYVIAGDQRFGIDVYGYGTAASFYYPGGLDLSEIVIK
jgi:hypothetical protein